MRAAYLEVLHRRAGLGRRRRRGARHGADRLVRAGRAALGGRSPSSSCRGASASCARRPTSSSRALPATSTFRGCAPRILGVPGVEAIHDVHFWTLTSGLHSASVHIRAPAAQRARARCSPASSACCARRAASTTRRSRSSRATRRSATSRPTTPEPHAADAAPRAPLHRERFGPRRRHRHVRRPDRAVRAGGGALRARRRRPGIIVTAGLAEIAAGSIAMGLGGYLAARSDAEHYASEREREHREVREKPAVEAREVGDIFRAYGLSDEEIAPILRAFQKRPQAWIDFMMRFELGLEKPDPRRALRSAATIGGAYARRRPHPARTVHPAPGRRRRADGLDRRHPGRARGLRLRQGTVHRRPSRGGARSRRR